MLKALISLVWHAGARCHGYCVAAKKERALSANRESLKSACLVKHASRVHEGPDALTCGSRVEDESCNY